MRTSKLSNMFGQGKVCKCLLPLLFFFFVLIISTARASSGEFTDPAHDLSERMALIVFQLSIIIFAAHIGGVIFEKLKLPDLLGEMISGIIIGPYLLGAVVLPGFEHGLFPLGESFPVSLELYAFTTVASIVLLFLVGLETDLETFLSCSLAGSVVGIGGVVVSFVFGDLAMVLFSKYLFGVHYGFHHPAALFLGVISTATSVGITARILSAKRKIDSIEGVTIISGAVIDDVLGIILLAVVLGVVRSGHVNWGSISIISLKAIGVWLGFSALGFYFAEHIGVFLKRFKDKSIIAVIGFGLALLLSGIFEKSGLAMIIGAYIMGLSLSKTDLSMLIQENLFVLNRFLVPVFFCVMGMLINFREMMSFKILICGALYVVFAVVGKIVGCTIPALFLNFNLRGALRVGVGMVPRGEVALIVAGIGLAGGIIGHDVFSLAMIMTFFTTIVTPPIFAKMLESDEPVQRKERQVKKEHQQIDYVMPNVETAEIILAKVIAAFEGEGFYVHTFHLREGIFQIRKAKTFVSMYYSEEKISFYCVQEDMAFIHTLFYEALAELEKTMRNLQKFSDRDNVGKLSCSFVGSKLDGISSIEIGDVVSLDTVNVDLKSTTKAGIIEEMLGLLVNAGKVKKADAAQAFADIMQREDSMSTGMQKGIALPHAKSDAVRKMVCAIGLKKGGVEFDSLDKQLSEIFILTLTPAKGEQKSYLQFMAEISKFLMNTFNHEKVLSCKENKELYALFTAAAATKK